jgi:hypothetical protein
MNPLRQSDLYHFGIVVDDFEQVRNELTGVAGIAWGLEGEYDVPVLFDDGAQTVSFRFAYSVDGPVRIELVQAVPGTLWDVPSGGQAHHLGYWAQDVAAVSEQLAASGLPRVAKVGAHAEDEPTMVVFHKGRFGPYYEVVDTSLRAGMFPNDVSLRP